MSVLVVAQLSSEIPEALMNNPVYVVIGRIRLQYSFNFYFFETILPTSHYAEMKKTLTIINNKIIIPHS